MGVVLSRRQSASPDYDLLRLNTLAIKNTLIKPYALSRGQAWYLGRGVIRRATAVNSSVGRALPVVTIL